MYLKHINRHHAEELMAVIISYCSGVIKPVYKSEL